MLLQHGVTLSGSPSQAASHSFMSRLNRSSLVLPTLVSWRYNWLDGRMEEEPVRLHGVLVQGNRSRASRGGGSSSFDIEPFRPVTRSFIY